MTIGRYREGPPGLPEGAHPIVSCNYAFQKLQLYLLIVRLPPPFLKVSLYVIGPDDKLPPIRGFPLEALHEAEAAQASSTSSASAVPGRLANPPPTGSLGAVVRHAAAGVRSVFSSSNRKEVLAGAS